MSPLRSARLRERWALAHPTTRRLVVAGAGITLFFLVLAAAAPLVAPYGEAQFRGIPQLRPPSAAHPFGTTNLSYDVASRVIFGARLAIEVVAASTLVAMVVGVPLGLLSGYAGGRLDRGLVMAMDAMYAFPSLLLAIVAAFALRRWVGQGVPAAALSISVIYVPQYFRVVRNQTLSVREESFVEAARALGAGPLTTMRRYVFPNVVQSVPVIFTLNAADAILTLAALGFLGYGVRVPAAEWGYDISRAIGDTANGFWWTALFPGLAILALTTGLTLLGEGINDLVNPLLRRRGGWRQRGPASPGKTSSLPERSGGGGAADPPRHRERSGGADPVEKGGKGSSHRGHGARGGPVSAPPALALEARGLRVWYSTPRGPLVAVDGIDLVAAPGECLGLVGESGCGKSTLGRAVLGLLPEGAGWDGELRVGGTDVSGLSGEELRRLRGEQVSLIFQEPMGRLDPLMRVVDHFVEEIRAHRPGTSQDEARRMCREVLAAMRIPAARAEQYPHELSGGMRQRVMIGLGVVLRPRLVVADEPTTALDTLVQAQILRLLRDLADGQGIAVLLITHNLGAVAETCERVAVMYAGRVVEVGPVEAVLTAPRHPYTQGLLASVIHLDSTELSTIPGAPPDLADPPPGCRFHPRCPHAMPVCRSHDPPAVGVPGGAVACWLHVPAEAMPPGGAG